MATETRNQSASLAEVSPQLFHRSGSFTRFEERGHRQFSNLPSVCENRRICEPSGSDGEVEKLIHHNHPEAVAGGVGWHIEALQI